MYMLMIKSNKYCDIKATIQCLDLMFAMYCPFSMHYQHVILCSVCMGGANVKPSQNVYRCVVVVDYVKKAIILLNFCELLRIEHEVLMCQIGQIEHTYWLHTDYTLFEQFVKASIMKRSTCEILINPL